MSHTNNVPLDRNASIQLHPVTALPHTSNEPFEESEGIDAGTLNKLVHNIEKYLLNRS